MSFTEDQVKIVQKAQSLAQLEPMSSFEDEDSLESQIASEIYEDEIGSLLCVVPWRFAVTQHRLNHVAAKPKGRYQHAWQLPTKPEILMIRAVTSNGVNIPFDRYGDKIYNDYDENTELILDYVFRAPEGDWPADFKSYAIYHLAMVFATIITRNEASISSLGSLSEKKLLVASRNHAQGRTAKKVDVGRLVRKRF